MSAITNPASRLSPNWALRICDRTSHPISAVPPIIEAIITILSDAIVV